MWKLRTANYCNIDVDLFLECLQEEGEEEVARPGPGMLKRDGTCCSLQSALDEAWSPLHIRDDAILQFCIGSELRQRECWIWV